MRIKIMSFVKKQCLKNWFCRHAGTIGKKILFLATGSYLGILSDSILPHIKDDRKVIKFLSTLEILPYLNNSL